jgi:hypothetical protein
MEDDMEKASGRTSVIMALSTAECLGPIDNSNVNGNVDKLHNVSGNMVTQ